MALNQKSAASAIAIDRLATQLAKDPQSKAFLPLAEEYCKVGMWEEAVAVLEDGLKYYPGFITAMVALGRAYDQLNQPTKARAVLEAAVKLSPDNLRAHRTLIKIYKTQGLTEEALKSCRVILVMNPRDEEALSVQASLGVATNADPEKPTTPAAIQVESPTSIPEPPLPSIPTAEPMFALVEEPKVAVEEPPRDLDNSAEIDDAAAMTNLSISVSADNMETEVHENDPAQVGELATIAPQTHSSGSTPKPSPHTKKIVQLESWLHSIERRRRDRVTSGELNS